MYTVKEIVLRGGPPFLTIEQRDRKFNQIYVDAFKGWASLYYVLKLMLSRGGPTFDMTINAFKG
jgi:hypothetical protein